MPTKRRKLPKPWVLLGKWVDSPVSHGLSYHGDYASEANAVKAATRKVEDGWSKHEFFVANVTKKVYPGQTK